MIVFAHRPSSDPQLGLIPYRLASPATYKILHRCFLCEKNLHTSHHNAGYELLGLETAALVC